MATDLKMALVLSVKDGITSPLAGIQKRVQAFGSNVAGLGRTADTHFTGMASALRNIGSVGVRAFSMVGNAVSGFVDKLMNGVKWAGFLGAGITIALGKTSADAALQMEGHLAKMTVALKDAGQAAEMLDWAKAFAAKTPFEMSEVVDASVRLEMYGLAAQKWLPLVGDMAGAMGRSVTDAVEAVADGINGEWERLKEFGIKSSAMQEAPMAVWNRQQAAEMKAQAEALDDQVKLLAFERETAITPKKGGGFSTKSVNPYADYIKQIKYESTQLKLFAKEAEDAADALSGSLAEKLESVMTERFAGGMEKLSETGVGQLSNLKDSFFQLKVAVGEALMPALKGAMTAVKSFVDGLVGGGQAEAIGESLGRAVTVALQYFSVLVGWLQANKQPIADWFSYFVDYGKYLVAWVYKNVPDILETFIALAAGIGEAMITLGITFVSLKTGFLTVGYAIGTAFLAVGTVVGSVLTGLLEVITAVVKAQNILTFGSLSKEVKDLEKATAWMGGLTKRIYEGTGTLAAMTSNAAWEGRSQNDELKAQAEKFRGMESRTQTWASGVRDRWSNVPEPVAPERPTTQFAPIVVQVALDGKVIAENEAVQKEIDHQYARRERKRLRELRFGPDY